ncbi:MAG TPA: VIT1/CCC1 transporter family protein [Euzebyales bacterium]|nr:VIT1/CCC1 transporter family protein [Euzebyales bacterium]
MSADVDRYRRNMQAEIDGAAIYHAMAAGERNPALVQVYRSLAMTEERHAQFWAERLRSAGEDEVVPRPTWQARALVWLARRLGARWVLSTIAQQERDGRTMYDHQPETAGTALPGDERSHARILRDIESAGLPGGAIARLEGRHRSVGGNALRAAVLGANDGLVSNLSLVMGVAGAALSSQSILITGLAGLLAGACSMAMGEWVSVRSSSEAAARQLAIESDELDTFPDEEAEELRLIYQAKGMSVEDAAALAAHVMADRQTALNVQAREELGIDPDELEGSPTVAAVASFVLFAVGAVIPVLPFMFTGGRAAVVLAVSASGLGLFALGAAITMFTGRGVLRSGLRQLAIGWGAALVTYGLGAAIGVSLA